MTSQSSRIYLYKITFEEVSYYYYGVHKEKKFNEYYMGSPVTHKWCWELYTPKKQILELFDFTDEGWIEAQKVETRLIKPFYNSDKWCLNESCGGIISLEVKRQTSRKVGNQQKENKTGMFALTLEERRENGKIYGKNGGKIAYEMGLGFHARTKEQKIEDGRRGGIISGKRNYEKGIGLGSISKEQRKNIVSRTNSQKWMCLETGYITKPGPLTIYQKNRGIDTSKRIRLS